MIYILEYKNKQIISLPKSGCTNIIKICTNNDKFISHNHSFYHNNCDINVNIHGCGSANISISNDIEKILIFRYAHERIKSFYFSNYLPGTDGTDDKIPFDEFIQMVIDDKCDDIPGFKTHIFNFMIFEDDIRGSRLVHLDDMNRFFINEFDDDISKYFIINKSEHYYKEEYRISYNYYLLEGIKNKFKEEYNFINESINNFIS